MDIKEYEKFAAASHLARHPWEIARVKIILFLIKKNRIQFSHLADIGSGDAFLLQNIIQYFPRAKYTAIDSAYTNDLIKKINKKEQGTEIFFYNSLEQLNNHGKSMDCFLLLDVLEHCEDDTAFLRSVLELRNPGSPTCILITVPAYQSLFSRHDKHLAHFRRYKASSLLSLCIQNKLKITEYGYFFFSLLPVRIVQLLGEKLTNQKEYHTIENWKLNPFFTKIITGLLWADFRFSYFLSTINIKLPGLSLFCICQSYPS